MLSKFEEQINKLGYSIPDASIPLHEYIPVVIHNGFAFVSGQLPRVKGELQYPGKLGDTVSIEQAQDASIICLLNGLSVLKQELGTLDKIKRIVKLTGFVNSATGFNQQSMVIDGASKFLFKAFGEKGRHARSALGVNELPKGSCVEVELIVAVEGSNY